MNSPSVVRKALFDIFRQMTPNDVAAARFFIRSEHKNKCENIFDLMEVLEELAYFCVSEKKVDFERLIELLGNIDRVDLQTKLQTYADKFSGRVIGDPSVSIASKAAESMIKDSNSQLQANTEVDELVSNCSRMSLDPATIAETNNPYGSSMGEESCSDETFINSEASSSEKITLHNYQLELSEKGKKGMNTIICSPTGSGKTITAASIIKHNLEEAKKRGDPYRVLYLVHIRYLVKHLAIDLRKILDDEVYPLDDDDLLNSEIVTNKTVVILTAQILDNALNSKDVDLSDYDLLVFDECHNTIRKHPYNEIMKKYHAKKRRTEKVPQVVGLSATLGGGHDPFKAIVKLCANMYTPLVSCVRDKDNRKELLEKNKAPMIDGIIQCKSRHKNEFYQQISNAMENYIVDLEMTQILNSNDFGSKEIESYFAQQKTKYERANLRVEGKMIDFLITMNKGLIYYNELTAFDALEYLQENLPEPDTSDMMIEKEIASVYKMTLKNIETFALNDQLENNDKLLKLKELLIHILKPNPAKKAILLCQTRFNAIHLKNIIMEDAELKEFVKADFIIGQNDNGLTQKQQAGVLKRFEENELNLLVATSIAEQGLNIPDCEIVIRYLYVTSDISRKQAHGRARKENSQCYLIADEDNNYFHRDYRNKLREKEMDAALVKVSEMKQEEFQEEVLQMIKWIQEAAEIEQKLNSNSYPYRSDDVDILCKECHKVLCRGSDIIKKGTDYICINPDFESEVRVMRCKEQHFRLDSNIGSVQCRGEQCKNKFGAIKKYKYGQRPKGYVLNAKSILLAVKGSRIKSPLKKWSDHPFPIETEPLNANN